MINMNENYRRKDWWPIYIVGLMLVVVAFLFGRFVEAAAVNCDIRFAADNRFDILGCRFLIKIDSAKNVAVIGHA